MYIQLAMSTTSSEEVKSSDSPTWQGQHALSPIPLSARSKRETLPALTKESYPARVHMSGIAGSYRENSGAPPFDYANSQHPRDYQHHHQPPPSYRYIATAPSIDSAYPMMHPQAMSSFESSGSSSQYQHPAPMQMYNRPLPMQPQHMYYPPPPYPPPPYGPVYGYPPHALMPPPPMVEYITVIQPQDVLSGRGGATNSHSGNREFRRLVKKHQKEYLHAKKRDKPGVAALVVDSIRQQGGRFLRKLDQTNHIGQVFYVEIGDERAKEKACQALREGAPDLRRKHANGKPLSLDAQENDSKKCDDAAEDEKTEEPDALDQESKGERTALQEKSGSPVAAQVTPNNTTTYVEIEVPHAPGEGPVMIRPCARLMPNRRPVEPFPVDQLSPEQRDMYLREFLPPSNPTRPEWQRLSAESEGTLHDENEMTDKPPAHPWEFVSV